jgi:hypothetical protein
LPRFKITLNNRWLVTGLSLLAMALVARAMLSSSPGGISAPVRGAVILPATAEPAEANAPAPDREAARVPAVAVAARDPFAVRPRVSSAPPVVDTAHLSALWTENGETLVLVNGRILHAGDAVGRMTIESATQEGVWVAHAHGRDFIALGGTFVLTSPAVDPAAVALSP